MIDNNNPKVTVSESEINWDLPHYQSTSADDEALATARLAWLTKHNPTVAAGIRTLARPDGSLVINDLTQTANDLDLAGVPATYADLVDIPAEVNEEAPGAVPDMEFGPMTELEVTATDLAVRVMCWNLSTSAALGERAIVDIATEDEARDILKREQIAFAEKDAEGWFSAGMAFENRGHRVSTIHLSDTNLRLLTIRALHVKFMRWDPPVEPILSRYFAMIAQQQAAEAAKGSNASAPAEDNQQ